MLRDDLMKQLGIASHSDIKVNTYGLTGSGIYFVNSCLKVLVRVSNSPTRYAEIVKFIQDQKNENPFLTSHSTSFVVRHVRAPQYIYV